MQCNNEPYQSIKSEYKELEQVTLELITEVDEIKMQSLYYLYVYVNQNENDMEKKCKEDHINAVQVELENLQEKNAKYYQGIEEKCNILVKEKRDDYIKQCKLVRKI